MRIKRHSRKQLKYVIIRFCLIIVFILIFVFIGTGYSMLTTKIEITGKASVEKINANLLDDERIEKSNSIVNITYEKTKSKNLVTCYKVNLEIFNKDKDFENCKISFNLSYGLTDVVSKNNIVEIDGNNVTISNEDPFNKNTKVSIQFDAYYKSDAEFDITKVIFENNTIYDINITNTTTLEETVEIENKQFEEKNKIDKLQEKNNEEIKENNIKITTDSANNEDLNKVDNKKEFNDVKNEIDSNKIKDDKNEVNSNKVNDIKITDTNNKNIIDKIKEDEKLINKNI